MLVLTRKLMEKLFIGDDICVTVVRLEGGQVRLGIDAPREVSVVRAELVPERLASMPRSGHVHGPNSPVPGPVPAPVPAPAPIPGTNAALSRGNVMIPPTGPHGNDTRHRGPSR